MLLNNADDRSDREIAGCRLNGDQLRQQAEDLFGRRRSFGHAIIAIIKPSMREAVSTLLLDRYESRVFVYGSQ